MATLRRKKGSDIWYVDFYHQGKRRRKSTKTADRKLAELLLKDIEVKIAKEEFGFQEISKSIGLAVFFEKFLAFSEATKAHNSFLIDKHAQKLFLRFCRDLDLDTVTPKLIEDFKLRRLSEVKPSSVNISLRHLKAMFETAVRSGYLDTNPFKGVKQVRIKGNKLPKFLTKRQITVLLDSIPDNQFKNLVVFYLYTGCRRGEALSLDWEDIDLKARRITINQTKSGESRLIPINRKLHSRLSKSARRTGKVFRFRENFVTQKFKKYLRASRLKGIDSLNLHSLRHTFASHLVMSGVDLYTVAKLLGHSSVAVTQMYAHLAPDYLKESIERLDF